MSPQSRYAARNVVLLTQHGKVRVIAPVLEPGTVASSNWSPVLTPTSLARSLGRYHAPAHSWRQRDAKHERVWSCQALHQVI